MDTAFLDTSTTKGTVMLSLTNTVDTRGDLDTGDTAPIDTVLAKTSTARGLPKLKIGF